MSAPAVPIAEPEVGVGDWLLVALLCALSGVIALFGVFFVPLYLGAVPMPVVIIPVGVALAVLPRTAYRLAPRMAAAAGPPVAWLVVTVWLNLRDNALYRGAPVAWQGWQFVLLLGVGSLAAAASVGLLWGTTCAPGPTPGNGSTQLPVDR